MSSEPGWEAEYLAARAGAARLLREVEAEAADEDDVGVGVGELLGGGGELGLAHGATVGAVWAVRRAGFGQTG